MKAAQRDCLEPNPAKNCAPWVSLAKLLLVFESTTENRKSTLIGSFAMQGMQETRIFSSMNRKNMDLKALQEDWRR